MTANVYATQSDVYMYGLPRGTLGSLGRLVASMALGAHIVLDGHGFVLNDPVIFQAVTSSGGALASPLVAGTTYYVIPVNDSQFDVAASANGSAITLTSTGASVKVATPLPIDNVLEFYSRWADGFMPAEVTPLVPDPDGRYPVLVTGVVAELAAKKLQQLAGHISINVDEFEKVAMAQLQRWSKGVPVRDPAQGAANTALQSSLVVTLNDTRGWGSVTIP